MKLEDTFLFCSIRESGRQRLFSLNTLYFFAIFGIFLIFTGIFLQELLEGFPNGGVVALAIVFAVAAGLFSCQLFAYLRYGFCIWRRPEQAQFLHLFDGQEDFASLCQQVEAEKNTSLVQGIPHVTVTPYFLYVQQKGYFELYHHSHVVSLSFQNGSGRMLCFTDVQGNDRELARNWDEQAVLQLMQVLGLKGSSKV